MIKGALIIDTETTGLGKADEIVEVACVDIEGRVLLNTLVRPSVPMQEDARAVNGITDEELLEAPTIEDLVPELLATFSDCLVLGWHFAFDRRLLRQYLRGADLRWTKHWRNFSGPDEEHGIMFWYGRFAAGTSRRRISLTKAGEDCGIKIEGPAHRALAGAQTARLVLNHMAQKDRWRY